MAAPKTFWNDARCAEMVRRWNAGETHTQLARRFGITLEATRTQAHRIGLKRVVEEGPAADPLLRPHGYAGALPAGDVRTWGAISGGAVWPDRPPRG